MRVLAIDDNPMFLELVRQGLTSLGWQVTVAVTGGEGLQKALADTPDVVILDIGLPDITGLEVARRLREAGRTVPVLMLTALRGPDAVAEGLDSGADDYLSKPFDVKELNARLKSLVRRSGTDAPTVLAFSDLRFDRVSREASVNGRRVRLTNKEQVLLEYLMLRAGSAVSRDELLKDVWRMSFDPGSNLVNAHLARLRGKLKSAGSDVQVVNARGVGFTLVDSSTVGQE